MNNKILSLCVTLVVGVVLAGSLLAPILNDVTTTHKTFENAGYYTYDAITEETSTVITWDPTTPNTFTIGDVALDLSGSPSDTTIIGSENFSCRYYYNNNSRGFRVYGIEGYNQFNTINNASAPITITVTNSSMDIDAASDKSYEMGGHGFILNTAGNGPLTLKKSDESAYILGESDIYLCGTTAVTGSGTDDVVGVFGYGSLDDGLTLSSFYGNTDPNAVSFGEVEATYEAVAGYEDLFKIEKFEFPITQNEATVSAVYSYFVVPTEVTAELSQHLTSGQNALLGAIPILVIVSLVLAAVGMIYVSRND